MVRSTAAAGAGVSSAMPRLCGGWRPSCTRLSPKRCGARVAASQAPVVVIEAIKLLEAGLSRALCDQVWVTRCPPRTADGAPERQSRDVGRQRSSGGLAAQMPPAEMIAQAAPRHRHQRHARRNRAAGVQSLGRSGLAVSARARSARRAARMPKASRRCSTASCARAA